MLCRSYNYFVSNGASVSAAFYDTSVDKSIVQFHLFHKKCSTNRIAYFDSLIKTSYVSVSGTLQVFVAVDDILLLEIFEVSDPPLKLQKSSILEDRLQVRTFQCDLLVRAFCSLTVS